MMDLKAKAINFILKENSGIFDYYGMRDELPLGVTLEEALLDESLEGTFEFIERSLYEYIEDDGKITEDYNLGIRLLEEYKSL